MSVTATGGVILPLGDRAPRIAADAFIAPTATLIGDVEIGAGSSIWFGCILRGDINFIRVGARSNLQDGTIVHVNRIAEHRTVIGDDVTVGHAALIHACTLESGSFVGMRATVMDGAVVESGAMVAAGALVTPGKRVPAGELWAGAPARRARVLNDDERASLTDIAGLYASLAREYLDLD
ncbi:MAG: gamma carbonic anhydrase family protein [Alphaproteobacteria bacterium]